MNTLSIDSPEFLHKSDKPRWLDRLARRIVLSKLRDLAYGELTVVEGERREIFGRRRPDFPLAATLRVKSAAFYSDVAFGGSIAGAPVRASTGMLTCHQRTGLCVSTK